MQMDNKHKLPLILGTTFSSILLLLLLLLLLLVCFCRKRPVENGFTDKEANIVDETTKRADEKEDLIKFQGGEDLNVHDILDAAGEVIGKSSYGTLYRASLFSSNRLMLLRFLRPTCSGRLHQVEALIQVLGSIRHPNLVPLSAFYAGPRGEKLLVYPFYAHANLAEFIRDGDGESHKWTIIYRISIGIARGLDYLHTGLQKPLVHGNLKSKNILLGRNYQPYVSDFGLHLLLNPTAGQKMLEDSAAEGYKSPELIKMKDACEQSDIFSLGVILLELLTGKKPINEKPTPDQELYLPNALRNAVLDHRLSDLYHPDILVSKSSGRNPVTEENILKFFQLAMTCCSPSPSIRPDIKQIIKKLEDLG